MGRRGRSSVGLADAIVYLVRNYITVHFSQYVVGVSVSVSCGTLHTNSRDLDQS